MIGTLGAKPGMSPQQITRSNDVKKSENMEKTQGKEESKVAKIAEQIANGTYKLDMSKTAKAVADTLL